MKRGKRSSAAKATKAAQPVQEVIESSKIPMAVHISGLVKPWATQELTEKLKSISGSEIVDFRVNASQSDVVATLSDTEGAEKAREALHDKTWEGSPNAQVLLVELVAPNFELPEPPVELSMKLDPVPVETALEGDKNVKEAAESSDKHERGVLTTKTQPPLTFRPKSEEQISQMRKRRNYDLDSTILGGRFYGDRDRKRRHAELVSYSNTTSHNQSSSSGNQHQQSASGGRHGGDRRYNDGGRQSGPGRYDRPNDRYDHYERPDRYARRDSGRY